MPQPKTGTRRVAALAASALLAAGAAGCGGGGGETLGNGVRLVKKDRLTTCTHLPYPPFEFERGGEIVGFDVDLVNLVAQRLGVRQEIVDTPFETIKTGADLNAGKCDIAATGLTITEERKKNLDFSVGYFDATQAVLARKGSAIRSLDDLKGKRLGAQASTTGEDYVKGKGIDPVSYESADAELNGLRSGQVDAIVQDLPVVTEWLKDRANAGFEIKANLRTGEQYGYAVKKGGNAELLGVVNQVIEQAKRDGRYDALYKKWIGPVPAPTR